MKICSHIRFSFLLSFSFTNLIFSFVSFDWLTILESMSFNGSNGSRVGHQDYINNLKLVQEPNMNDHHFMGGAGAILYPIREKYSVPRNESHIATFTTKGTLQWSGL